MKSISSNSYHYLGLLLIVIFIVAILLLFPVWSEFSFDSDEGVNLGKAMLLERGYELYSDIWSDQPPVFTYILAAVISGFGYNVVIARLLVIAFSALLMWALLKILSTYANLGTTIFGLILIIVADPFIRISYRVMVGLPAISLALFSLFAIMQWHRSSRYGWLFFSALTLGLSVMTKLFTGLLAPILFFGLFFSDFKNRNKEASLWKSFKSSIFWTIIFTLVLGIIFWFFVGADNVQLLISPHLIARGLERFQSQSFSASTPLLLLSGTGAILMLWDKKWIFIYPMAWMAFSYFSLINHIPVWYHQKLLFTVPAILIASYAANEGFVLLSNALRGKLSPFWGNARNYFRMGAIVFFVSYLNAALPPKFLKDVVHPTVPPNLGEDFNETHEATLVSINTYLSDTEWMLTDKPMYAFRTGVLMPPNTAAITGKRYLTGNLTDDEIIQDIVDYSPEQVLLGRYEYEDVFSFLSKDYTLLEYQYSRAQHYVINELLE